MKNRGDLSQKTFGFLTVISFHDVYKRNARWLCKCVCGKEFPVLALSLKSGKTKSCGCMASSFFKKDLTGKKFGRLTVINQDGVDKWGNCKWFCQCDCGKTKSVSGGKLLKGYTKSCGCLNSEIVRDRKTTHGLSNTRLFRIWTNMKRRCFDETNKAYKRYGGRGITICEDWKNDFQSFYNWAISNGYNDVLTVDRIDNDGNYEPSNCRWITRSENSKKRNKKEH